MDFAGVDSERAPILVVFLDCIAEPILPGGSCHRQPFESGDGVRHQPIQPDEPTDDESEPLVEDG